MIAIKHPYESCSNKHKPDCIYHLPIHLENRKHNLIPFGWTRIWKYSFVCPGDQSNGEHWQKFWHFEASHRDLRKLTHFSRYFDEDSSSHPRQNTRWNVSISRDPNDRDPNVVCVAEKISPARDGLTKQRIIEQKCLEWHNRNNFVDKRKSYFYTIQLSFLGNRKQTYWELVFFIRWQVTSLVWWSCLILIRYLILSRYTEIYLLLLLVKSTGIKFYLPFSDWYGTTRISVWFQINRKMVNTIWFQLI